MSSITNQFRTVMLLGLLTALLLWAGSLLGGTQGLTIAIFIVLAMNIATYWYSDRIVLAMYRAKPTNQKDAPELYSIVKEVSHKAKIPMPKVYIIPTESPNAFATGRNPKHSAIACTQGILKLLSKEELEGVIAHEASHIKNRDTLIQVVAATIAGIISYLAFFARIAMISGNKDRDNKGIELLMLAILTPIIATLIQLAISRSREYIADESAAKSLHNSAGLASALARLESGIRHSPLSFGNPSTSSIFIANPFSSTGMFALFSTHPPINERIKKLKEIAF